MCDIITFLATYFIQDLQKASATVGPISVGIDAHLPTFHFYKSGVYHDPKCSSVHLDHGVLVVGYGTEVSNGKGKVMNSCEKDGAEVVTFVLL